MKQQKKLDKYSYITEGPILKSLVKLSLPIMLSQLMHTLYNLADTLWVGKIGADAVAAISISFPLIFLMISIAGGMTIAGTALIAQHKGAGHSEEIDKMLGQIFCFVGFLAVVIGVMGFIMSKEMIIWMGAEANIVDDATGYLQIIFAGIPFMFGFFIFSSTLRGIGDTLTPTKMMVFSTLMNIIIDPILIFGIGPVAELGIQGAALATILSRAVVTIAAMKILIQGNKGLKLRFENIKPDFKIIKQIIKIGVPSSIEQSMIALGQIFMTSLVTVFGTMTLAAYGIVTRIISLPRILAFGLSASATTMVGQNIGADKKERAEKTAYMSIITIFITLALIGIIVIAIPEEAIKIFNDEPEVLRLGSEFLRLAGFAFGFIGVMTVVNGIFKGAGRTVQPMIISTLSLWLIRVPLAYLLSQVFNFQQWGIWLSVLLSNVFGALLGITWLKASDWSRKVIQDKSSNLKLRFNGNE